MSLIGKNIRKIRNVKKLSQSAFSDLFSLSRTSVGAYEEERAEPKIETIIQIANYFGISIDTLLTKELTVNDVYHFDVFKEIQTIKGKQSVASTSLAKIAGSMSFVSIKDSVEYLTHFTNKDFIRKLGVMNIPGLEDTDLRAFEVNGSAMAAGEFGINHTDVLVCKKASLKKVSAKKVIVAVTSNQMLCRRFSIAKKMVTLIADNSNYPVIEVAVNDIVECWEGVGIYSQNLSATQPIESRVALLEEQIAKLLKK